MLVAQQRKWFTIYSFFRTSWMRITKINWFNLQHLSLFRHVKTINFPKTMMISFSQYVSHWTRSLGRRLNNFRVCLFVCFHFASILNNENHSISFNFLTMWNENAKNENFASDWFIHSTRQKFLPILSELIEVETEF